MTEVDGDKMIPPQRLVVDHHRYLGVDRFVGGREGQGVTGSGWTPIFDGAVDRLNVGEESVLRLY